MIDPIGLDRPLCVVSATPVKPGALISARDGVREFWPDLSVLPRTNQLLMADIDIAQKTAGAGRFILSVVPNGYPVKIDLAHLPGATDLLSVGSVMVVDCAPADAPQFSTKGCRTPFLASHYQVCRYIEEYAERRADQPKSMRYIHPSYSDQKYILISNGETIWNGEPKIVGSLVMGDESGQNILYGISVDPMFQNQGYAKLLLGRFFEYSEMNTLTPKLSSFTDDGERYLKGYIEQKMGTSFDQPML